MSRLCAFADSDLTEDILSTGWASCLQLLGRYKELSSIAGKAVFLLQESAKRLLVNNHDFGQSQTPTQPQVRIQKSVK